MKHIHRYPLVLLVFFAASFPLFAQEKKEIQLQVKTTTIIDRQNRMRESVEYKWRYIHTEEWVELGRKYGNLKPVLDQYESSSQLFQKSRNIQRYGIITGGALFIGGIVTAFTSLNTETNTRGFVGLGMAFVGGYTMLFSYRIGTRKFEESIEEYNRCVRNDSASNRSFELGLAYTNTLNAPLLSLRLSL